MPNVPGDAPCTELETRVDGFVAGSARRDRQGGGRGSADAPGPARVTRLRALQVVSFETTLRAGLPWLPHLHGVPS